MQSETRSHLDSDEQEQGSSNKEMQGPGGAKKARLDDLKQHQTSEATNFIDELKKTEGRILQSMEDGLSKLEKRLEDKKSRSYPLVLTSTIELPDISLIFGHISVVSPDKLWVGELGSLKQVDGTGHVLRTLDDTHENFDGEGSHTVSVEGDLVFMGTVRSTQSTSNVEGIHKMTADGSITTLLRVDGSVIKLRCIHSSHINGNLLIGLIDYNYNKCRVLRRDRTGSKIRETRCDGTEREIEDIELDEEGQRLYKCARYITENKMNGDIVVSDTVKNALVVVDRSGRHRFDYTGQSTDESFYPRHVCTDVLGRILVLHTESPSRSPVYHISLLDKEGNFLINLLNERKEPFYCLCVDEKNNIYVGFQKKIKVFS